MAGRPISRLVHDDGERFAYGDRVRLNQTLSTPPELHAVRDATGPFEVLTCTPVPVVHKRLLQLMLREIEPS
jgi:hypothetical protein